MVSARSRAVTAKKCTKKRDFSEFDASCNKTITIKNKNKNKNKKTHKTN